MTNFNNLHHTKGCSTALLHSHIPTTTAPTPNTAPTIHISLPANTWPTSTASPMPNFTEHCATAITQCGQLHDQLNTINHTAMHTEHQAAVLYPTTIATT